MPKTDQEPKISQSLLLDIPVAFALLTRLPLPRLPDTAFEQQARAAWAFPLVGLVAALLAGGVGGFALWVGLPDAAAVGLVLGMQIIITGAMHEDGLADTADGLWGGWSAERRLEIMQDSAIGTYGVLSLILSLGLRWAALSVIVAGGNIPLVASIIAVGVVSRGLMPTMMMALPHARNIGLSHSFGTPGRAVSTIAASLATFIAIAVSGAAVLIPIGLACVGVTCVALIARAKIGGQTGDILGASQQIAEIIMLLSFAAMLGS
jgi:adenosylcobinamide-GDP ribazoletransferase